MNKPILNYRGVGDYAEKAEKTPAWRRFFKKIPLSFLIVVVAPTVLVAITTTKLCTPSRNKNAAALNASGVFL